jgi:hypothetical protein
MRPKRSAGNAWQGRHEINWRASVKRPWDDGNFNPEALTYWGCKLFDNEADARKGFG